MERITFLTHQGKQILYHNFTKADPADWQSVINASKNIIKNQKEHSVLALTNVADAQVDETVQKEISSWLSFNKPFIKASAIIGVTGFRKLILNTVTKLSGRKINKEKNLKKIEAIIL